MRCYKKMENGMLQAVGIGPGGTEITESEYNALLREIQEKGRCVKALYSGTIAIEDVPAEWQEEIQRRVNEWIAEEGVAEDQELSAEEALDIILSTKGD